MVRHHPIQSTISYVHFRGPISFRHFMDVDFYHFSRKFPFWNCGFPCCSSPSRYFSWWWSTEVKFWGVWGILNVGFLLNRSDSDYDWGLSQLDAIMDRREITGSHFLVLTNFGDHCLHHLFPTLDHGTLELLYPTFEKVCQQFNVGLRMTSQLELVKGSYLQMARIEPNPNPPDLTKKYWSYFVTEEPNI